MLYKKGKDTNKTNKIYARNRKIFESVMNLYTRLRFRSDIAIISIKDDSKTTPNVARPSSIDYCCDCDLIIQDVINDKQTFFAFMKDILFEEKNLAKGKVKELKQKIGQQFLNKHIWPINGYFTTIREKMKN